MSLSIGFQISVRVEEQLDFKLEDMLVYQTTCEMKDKLWLDIKDFLQQRLQGELQNSLEDRLIQNFPFEYY